MALTTQNVVKLKKQAKVFYDVKVHQLNVMMVGAQGSGKTLTIADLLRLGLKVYHINTDLGGVGLTTVHNEIISTNERHLLKNLVTLEIDNYDEMWDLFLNDPTRGFPDIYKFDPDIIFWDGFSNYQQSHCNNKVSDIIPERIDKKTGENKVSEIRQEGLQLDIQDWGALRSATLKSMDRFFRLHNRVTGKVWHKIVTCHLKSYQKQAQKVGEQATYEDVIQPNVSGISGIVMGAAFDLIIWNKLTKSLVSDTVKYSYITRANGTNCCKNRGFDLKDEEEAKFGLLWTKITNQLGIEKDAKDEKLIEN